MVEPEIWMHMLAYNLIRGVMAKVAEGALTNDLDK